MSEIINKKFNITGTCIPGKHYMVNINNKLRDIKKMVDEGDYFTINRPRQYGKTTTMFLLEKKLLKTDNYVVIRLSFEGLGDTIFRSEGKFIQSFINQLRKKTKFFNNSKTLDFINSYEICYTFEDLDEFITDLIFFINKKVVLMIDEVDKSSNNQLFLNFIGLLRDKYLRSRESVDYTFNNVILAGVHDVKNLKLKIRPDAEQKYNSPWNIAVNFNVDLSFNPNEISTMLEDYAKSENVEMNIYEISKYIYYYTSGYPFLVSNICKIIDEEILPQKNQSSWNKIDVDEAVQILLKRSNTNFESLIKNLENNNELYNLVFEIVIEGVKISNNQLNPIIYMATTYGIFKHDSDLLEIHNIIYKELIYNYMSSKIETSMSIDSFSYRDDLIKGNVLNLEKTLLKFQEFMKEQYSKKDKKFLERNGRLIFLAFIKLIINGLGYDFKEVQISEEKRLDVVITFYNQKYIIELKIWREEKYHKKGIKQLCDYLEKQNQSKGYLVIFNYKTKKQWKQDRIKINDKEIFAVWV